MGAFLSINKSCRFAIHLLNSVWLNMHIADKINRFPIVISKRHNHMTFYLTCYPLLVSAVFPATIMLRTQQSHNSDIHSKCVYSGHLQGTQVCSTSLLFADDVVLLTLSDQDLQQALREYAAKCEVVEIKVCTSKCQLNWFKHLVHDTFEGFLGMSDF